MSGTQKKGKKYTNKDFKRVTIWCKPSEWERLNYLSADSGKTLSAWAIDKALKGKVGNYNSSDYDFDEKGERGCIKPLCVESEKWDIIKSRAEKKGISTSKYFLSVTLA